MNSEKKKVALVTGGERGIGKGIIQRLIKDGYDIVSTYFFDVENTEAVIKEASDAGRKCVYFQSDFRDAKQVQSIIKKAVDEMGQLDLVVNNAAIMPPRLYQYEYTAEHIDEVLSVNYRAYMLIMRDAIRYWIRTHTQGNIVNIASESAIRSHQKFSLYGGIKSAIVRSSCNAALDASPYGIRINCVLPGCIDTIPMEMAEKMGISKEEVLHREDFARNMIPLRRQGQPIEIGNAVCWLASEEASYITGIALPVEGGLTLPGLTDMIVEDDEIVHGMCTERIFGENAFENW
ncbi:MAG: SDR family NAD(P)-dependent oxidoreductase [Oliverpabstia sp.]